MPAEDQREHEHVQGRAAGDGGRTRGGPPVDLTLDEMESFPFGGLW
jgi:hypothetical protein